MRATLSLIAAVFISLFGFNTAMSAEPSAELSAEIQSLNTELIALQASEKALFAEQATLKAEEKRLIDVKELLDGAAKNFNTEVAQWEEDAKAHNAEAARQRAYATQVNATVNSYNSRCSGSGNESYVRACNAERARLEPEVAKVDEWKARVDESQNRGNDRLRTLQMKEKGLRERYADLTRGTLDWARRKKENNWQLNEFEARRHSIQQRLRAAWDSPAVKDLEQRNKLSQECRRLAESADPNNLMDTRLEQAHRCLQRVWDGAR